MSLKFGRIQPWTAELAALDQFKKSFIQEYSKYFDDLLSGERSLPFGLLVSILRNIDCFRLDNNSMLFLMLDVLETDDTFIKVIWASS